MSEGSQDIASLVSALDRLTIAIESAATSQAADEWVVVDESAASSSQIEGSLHSNHSAPSASEHSVPEVPDCPEHLVAICRRLRGKQPSPEFRARRAWEAGFWAKQVLDGKRSKPLPSPPLEGFKPAVYIILRAPGVECPTRVSTASELFRLLGRLDRATVCHGFPSLAEAEVYCAGAGTSLPEPYQWRR